MVCVYIDHSAVNSVSDKSWIWVLSQRAGLKFNQKENGYTHIQYYIIALKGTSFLERNYCSPRIESLIILLMILLTQQPS